MEFKLMHLQISKFKTKLFQFQVDEYYDNCIWKF